jgi:hypothetical protein
MNLQGLLKKYCALCKSLKCTSVGANLQPLDWEADAIQLYHLFSMTIVQKKIKLLRK